LVHPYLPQVPFRRVFNRTLMIVAFAGLWPLLRALEIRSLAALGLPSRPGWWREVAWGWVLGVGSLAVGGVALWGLGYRSFTGLPAGWGRVLLGAAVAGVVVGVVEELFFRGGILGGLRRATGQWTALWVSSAVYSVVHFLQPKGARIAADAVQWWSGVEQLGLVLRYWWMQPGLVVGFGTLLLAGMVLAASVVRTQAVYFAIGMHAGWVMALKTCAAVTEAAVPRRWWGGGSLDNNLLIWPVLAGLFWWLWRQPKRS
jgi:membrane protease YdiL (CAAX protease family)